MSDETSDPCGRNDKRFAPRCSCRANVTMERAVTFVLDRMGSGPDSEIRAAIIGAARELDTESDIEDRRRWTYVPKGSTT